jgi:hypothetical protein
MSHSENDKLVDYFIDHLDEYPLWCYFNVVSAIFRVEEIFSDREVSYV